jgi:hypothetical protein
MTLRTTTDDSDAESNPADANLNPLALLPWYFCKTFFFCFTNDCLQLGYVRNRNHKTTTNGHHTIATTTTTSTRPKRIRHRHQQQQQQQLCAELQVFFSFLLYSFCTNVFFTDNMTLLNTWHATPRVVSIILLMPHHLICLYYSFTPFNRSLESILHHGWSLFAIPHRILCTIITRFRPPWSPENDLWPMKTTLW